MKFGAVVGRKKNDQILFLVVVVVVFLTLTDPLRIQPWSQDRRNQTKSNRESEISRESSQQRTVVIATNPNLWNRKIFIEKKIVGERAFFAGVVGQKIWIF